MTIHKTRKAMLYVKKKERLKSRITQQLKLCKIYLQVLSLVNLSYDHRRLSYIAKIH